MNTFLSRAERVTMLCFNRLSRMPLALVRFRTFTVRNVNKTESWTSPTPPAGPRPRAQSHKKTTDTRKRPARPPAQAAKSEGVLVAGSIRGAGPSYSWYRAAVFVKNVVSYQRAAATNCVKARPPRPPPHIPAKQQQNFTRTKLTH